MKRVLFVASVYRPDLYKYAKEAFAKAECVDVVLDRRVGERRRPDRPAAVERDKRRRGDRRQRLIDEGLRKFGWAVVPSRS